MAKRAGSTVSVGTVSFGLAYGLAWNIAVTAPHPSFHSGCGFSKWPSFRCHCGERSMRARRAPVAR